MGEQEREALRETDDERSEVEAHKFQRSDASGAEGTEAMPSDDEPDVEAHKFH